MRDAQLRTNLSQIALDSALILQHRGAADDLQIRDPCQGLENLVLHAIGKVFVLFFVAKFFDQQNGDALFDDAWRRMHRTEKEEDRAPSDSRQYQQQDHNLDPTDADATLSSRLEFARQLRIPNLIRVEV